MTLFELVGGTQNYKCIQVLFCLEFCLSPVLKQHHLQFGSICMSLQFNFHEFSPNGGPRRTGEGQKPLQRVWYQGVFHSNDHKPSPSLIIVQFEWRHVIVHIASNFEIPNLADSSIMFQRSSCRADLPTTLREPIQRDAVQGSLQLWSDQFARVAMIWSRSRSDERPRTF